MAVADETSTEEEVKGVDGETQDETEETKSEDETQTTDNKSDESEDEGDAAKSEEESKDETDEEEDKPTFDKRFPRFEGETLEEYVKNLEEGYANSSSEAVRLSRELTKLKDEKLAAIANDKGSDETTVPAPNPDLEWAKNQRETEWKKDWEEFAELHPEVNQDDTLFKEFDSLTGEMFSLIQKREHRTPSLREAMVKAWAVMNPDEGKLSKEEEIALKTKDTGSDTKKKGVSKDAPKPQFTDKQIETAKKVDPTLRDKSDKEIIETLSKYVK